MSEETKERGLLTDIAIFVVVIGLGLGAIYTTGNWPWFLKMLANLEAEVRSFISTLTTNIQSVTDVVKSAPSI